MSLAVPASPFPPSQYTHARARGAACAAIILTGLSLARHEVVAAACAASPETADSYVQVSNGAEIARMLARRCGRQVQIDWRVDNNGRGEKLRERVELGEDELPRQWHVEGTNSYGLAVRDHFAIRGGRASWQAADGAGSASVKGSMLYWPAVSSPWKYAAAARRALAAPGHTVAGLPGGEFRLERLREVQLGAGATARQAVAYALWGVDVRPVYVLLQPDGRFMGSVGGEQGVFVEQSLAGESAAFSRLAMELDAEYLRRLSKELAHRYEVPVYLRNVRVFDFVTGTLSPPTTVVVFGQRIAGVHDDPPPPGAVVVEGNGDTVLPGLHDMHNHIPDGWQGLLNIAAGVTTLRDMGNDNEKLLALERSVDSGEVLAPHIHRAGFLEGRSPYSANDGFVVGDLPMALEKVRWYADHGYSQIKIYNSLSPEWVKPVAEEAHRLGLRVSGHVPAFMSAERAIHDGYDEINHINMLMLGFILGPKEDTRTSFRFTVLGERLPGLDLGREDVQRVVRLMKERGTTLDTTLAVFEWLMLGRPGQTLPHDVGWLDHMPIAIQRQRRSGSLDVKPAQYPQYDAGWRKMLEMTRLVEQEGIRIVPGTDDMPGFMLHSELELYSQIGIANPRVLQIATLDSARYLGTDQQAGRIGPRQQADLMLVAGDPTRDISALRQVRLVVKDGALFYPEDIHRALGIRPFAAKPTVTAAAGTKQ